MNIRTRLLSAVALTATAALALAACSSNGSTPPETSAPTETSGPVELTTLKVATIGIISDGGLQLGIEQGFFEEEGLEIETSIVANPPAGLAAAQSGQVDVAYAPSIPLLNGLAQGVPLQVIAGADGYPDDAAAAAEKVDSTGLYAAADSGITDLADLAGKTIAIPARKAQLEVNIAAALNDAGVDPNSINWVVLDFTSAVAALSNGTVDAAGLVNPFTLQAEEVGHLHLVSPGKVFFETGAVGLWTVGENTATQKSELIAAFQRAILKTNQYANANSEAAVQAGIDYTNSPLALEDIVVPFWPEATEHLVEDVERTSAKLVALGFMEQEVDLTGLLFEGN